MFIKNPESLFLLEEVRERKYDTFVVIHIAPSLLRAALSNSTRSDPLMNRYARKIQVTYRRWKAQQYYEELKKKVAINAAENLHCPLLSLLYLDGIIR